MRLGLGLHARADSLIRAMTRWWRHRPRTVLVPRQAERLHIGCGPQVLEGWTNIDLEPHPGMNLVHDVRDGLPFRGVRYIFAEHFLEHLTYDEGFRFLKECRASLRDDGVLRLSTPNLDWVVATQHAGDHDRVRSCFAMNKAFRGWGHQFLYNAETLAAVLRAAGFATLSFHAYAESSDPILANLERHERSADLGEMQHVLIVEARGRGDASFAAVAQYVDDYDRAIRA